MTVSQRASTFLLIAPPGGGKPHFCLEKIRETAAQAPLSPDWVIVRDRLQAAGYRGLLQQRGLGLGVEVATFGDLYEEALARAGGGILAADEPSLHALVQSVVDEAAAAGALRHFSRISAAPGFAAALRERFAELKRALVWPEQLAALAQRRPGPASAALGELAYLYAAYQRRLQAVNWADREGITWMGLDALRADPALLGDIRLVLVDGFDSFNPARRQTLKALAGRVGELWITLPGEPEMRRPAHRRFARALRELQADLPLLEIVSLPRGSASAGPFAALEPRLFEPPGPAAPPVEQVTLLEAQSPDEEAREALRWIKARIVRDGFSPSDCALIVPDFPTYRAALLAAAAEFGLPLRLTYAARLIDTPPITALLDLLYLPLRSYPLRLLLDTVRAPFFDLSSFELRREDARLLEIVSRYGQISEGLALWHDVLGELACEVRPESAEVAEAADNEASVASVEQLEEGQPVPALPEGETAARLDRGLQCWRRSGLCKTARCRSSGSGWTACAGCSPRWRTAAGWPGGGCAVTAAFSPICAACWPGPPRRTTCPPRRRAFWCCTPSKPAACALRLPRCWGLPKGCSLPSSAKTHSSAKRSALRWGWICSWGRTRRASSTSWSPAPMRACC